MRKYFPDFENVCPGFEEKKSRFVKYVEYQSDQNSTGKAGEHCRQPGGEWVQSRSRQETERFDFEILFKICSAGKAERREHW